MAMFRGESHRPFELIDNAMRLIFISADFCAHLWPKAEAAFEGSWERVFSDQQEFDAFSVDLEHHQAVIWNMPDKDPIAPLVTEAVTRMEAFADAAAAASDPWTSPVSPIG